MDIVYWIPILLWVLTGVIIYTKVDGRFRTFSDMWTITICAILGPIIIVISYLLKKKNKI